MSWITYSFPVKMVLLVIIRCSVGRDQIVQWAFIRMIWAWLSDLNVLNCVKCSERSLFCIAIWFVSRWLIANWLLTSLLSTNTEWWNFRFSILFWSLRIWSYNLLKNLVSSFGLSLGVICKEKWFFDDGWLLVGLTYLKNKFYVYSIEIIIDKIWLGPLIGFER